MVYIVIFQHISPDPHLTTAEIPPVIQFLLVEKSSNKEIQRNVEKKREKRVLYADDRGRQSCFQIYIPCCCLLLSEGDEQRET